MKRIITLALSLVIVFTLAACAAKTAPELKKGQYFATGSDGYVTTPYININTADKEIAISNGMVYSMADFGTYEIADDTLTVSTAMGNEYSFRIEENALVMTEKTEGDIHFNAEIGTEFKLGE